MQSHVHRIREELPAVELFLLAIWGVNSSNKCITHQLFSLYAG
jgi:hypothetical protein